jgi:hypothetical protein
MTTEERFERIEHPTAGMAEERRKDREEYKALWRDLAARTESIARHVDALAVETRLRILEVVEAGERTDARLRALSESTDARLKALGEATDARIAALVSAIGEHVRLGHPQK